MYCVETSSGRRAGLLAVALAAAGAGCGSTADAAPDEANALHGAAPMAEQEKILAGLYPEGFDVTAPPPMVDPVIWDAMVPDDNKMTAERVELGRKLYFDTRLSADGTVSCATCHDVTRGFTDQRPVSEGIKDQLGQRNAPTTLNAALLQFQFLDGRVRTLEEQALLPIINPIEMGQPDGKAAMAGIAGDAAYEKMFQAAYGRAPNYDDVGRAIAAFERTLIFLDSPFDRYLRGEADAISEQAKQGWALYNGKARCVTCHPLNLANPLGTDNRFHNVGVSARHQDFEKLALQALVLLEKDPSLQNIDELALETELSELGRFMVTRNSADLGAFRTLQIRNVGITGPYMHDGSMQTLWDVMDHYNKGGEPNLNLDGGIEALDLSEEEIEQLVVFMFTLTDRRFEKDNQRALAAQRAHASKNRPFRDPKMASREDLGFGKKEGAR
jgi:cytochrome c peroxidase